MNEIIECKRCNGSGQIKRHFDAPIETCPECKGKKGTPIFPANFPPRPWIVCKNKQGFFYIASKKTGYVIANDIRSRRTARLLANSPIMFAALKQICNTESGETYDEMCDIYTDCSTCDNMIGLAHEALNVEIFKTNEGENEK